MSNIKLVHPVWMRIHHWLATIHFNHNFPYSSTWDQTLQSLMKNGVLSEVMSSDWDHPVVATFVHSGDTYYIDLYQGVLRQINYRETKYITRARPSLNTKVKLLKIARKHLSNEHHKEFQTDSEERELFLKTLHDEINQNK